MKMNERIKYLREKADMTQEELGAIIGVQKSAIRKYEKGEVENIKRSSIKKMADAFGVSPAYLMGWDEPSKNESSFSEKIQENFGTESIELLTLFQKLNENGKRKAIENLQDLTAIEKYTTSEKVYNVKIAARNGEFKETTITESELQRIKNLPDAEEF